MNKRWLPTNKKKNRMLEKEKNWLMKTYILLIKTNGRPKKAGGKEEVSAAKKMRAFDQMKCLWIGRYVIEEEEKTSD